MDSKTGTILDKIRHNTGTIGEHILVDYSQKKIGTTVLPYFNVSMLTFAYALNSNVLLIGEPGFGKTTAAKVMGAAYGGYPFDLFESAQMQGHPEQTVESLVGRLDFSRLAKEEKVIWQLGLYLPLIILDEINRLPGGKQDVLLNGVDTGRFSYLNDTFFQEKMPFFATANNPDDGNHIIIPPMADRFAMSMEMGDQGPYALAKIGNARRNIREYLCDRELTGKILSILNDNATEVPEKVKELSAIRKKFREKLSNPKGAELQMLVEDEMAHLRGAIAEVPFSAEAHVFLQCIYTELNYGGKRGRKRSCDSQTEDTHTKSLACSCTKNAFSPRGYDALEKFSQAIALYMGSPSVEKEHIRAIAPYVLQHRMIFTEDFASQHEDKDIVPAGEAYYNAPTFAGYLSDQLVGIVDTNYMKSVHDEIALVKDMLLHPERLTDKQRKEAEAKFGKPDKQDHPLLKALIYELKRRK
ncbi:MAG TPA: AAA domain-containing protein [Nanoarchaeota archaeon]|nr:AAA domain-containing protein [Nanoarchaeota archaeon]